MKGTFLMFVLSVSTKFLRSFGSKNTFAMPLVNMSTMMGFAVFHTNEDVFP